MNLLERLTSKRHLPLHPYWYLETANSCDDWFSIHRYVGTALKWKLEVTRALSCQIKWPYFNIYFMARNNFLRLVSYSYRSYCRIIIWCNAGIQLMYILSIHLTQKCQLAILNCWYVYNVRMNDYLYRLQVRMVHLSIMKYHAKMLKV